MGSGMLQFLIDGGELGFGVHGCWNKVEFDFRKLLFHCVCEICYLNPSGSISFVMKNFAGSI